MYQKIFRFRVSLTGSEPEIWREIDVPDHYNFWELHVAIQDAMGWLDYHLHEFTPHKAGPTKGLNMAMWLMVMKFYLFWHKLRSKKVKWSAVWLVL
jgi:hypothetical protein